MAKVLLRDEDSDFPAMLERLRTSWTGHQAEMVVTFEPDERPEVPFSELAMHTKIAGKSIEAVSVFYQGGKLIWLHVLVDGHVVDGLPTEVMTPGEVSKLEDYHQRFLGGNHP